MNKIKIFVSIVIFALVTLVIAQERRLYTAYLANTTKAIEAERQHWHQILIDQDFAHYDGKTGKWLLYTKEEFLMDHQIALASVSRNELFPLPGPEQPVIVPVSPIKSKKK